MTIDLTDTTTGAIDQALTEARHRLGGMTLGMVLTLIIVTDEAAQYDAIRAANQAAREHPCRILAIIARKAKADSRLDAEIRVGESSPGETIVLRMYGPLGQHADSVVAPLLVPDVPVVTWWPDDAPEIPAKHPLGALAQRRVTDSAAAESPHDMLATLAGGLPAGRHRLRLDPGHAVALAARRHARPGAPGDHRGRDRGRGGQPDRRPDRGLAVAAPRTSRSRGPSPAGPGHHRGDVQHAGRATSRSTRSDGRTATLSWPGRIDRMVALHRRDTAELLAEELRRLDPDEVYAETLGQIGAVIEEAAATDMDEVVDDIDDLEDLAESE